MIDHVDEDGCPIVGIGASAGGLEALSELVKSIPENTGMAHVVIQHLSPDHPSIMDQLLSTHAKIPVVKIKDRQTVKPDTIYVLPAGPYATVEGSTLHLHDRDPEQAVRAPIDQFLQSLAEARGRSAFAVILSGTGSDGTVGIRAIKQAGGFVIVQKSESARFPGMPDSAAATGLVDFTLIPRKIPARLMEILNHQKEVLSESGVEQRRADIEDSLAQIVATLDDHDGHDFSEYKPGTLIRRVERRMTLRRENNVDEFIETLQNDPDERSRLLQDFLIGVTRFFRDEDVFEQLDTKAIIPMLSNEQNSFRIWVPGCSTGEEVYSIGMLISEKMAETKDKRQWQIFGTDIDGAALSAARSGMYSESQLEGVSDRRRERFFVQNDGNWQIIPQLRDKCIFAPHNLLQDPPFSRLDLISCRNLLIYLTSDIQKKVIPRFHYGLKKSGFLLLGPSESLGDQAKYFKTLDRDSRLFQRNDDTQATFSTLPTNSTDAHRREKRLLRPQQSQSAGLATIEPSFEQQLFSYFARQSAPPFASINANDEVTYISEKMGAYIKPSQGMPSASLEQFLVRDLRLPVRSIIREARNTGIASITKDVLITEAGDPHVIDLEAVPLPFQQDTILITLQPVRTQEANGIADTAEARDDLERDLIERELTSTRQRLNAALNNYQSTEQELKSSNEELLSMNEELQSSNEELETSREELQSINEELETVNSELIENNRQLLAVNSDLKNLFDSTDVATVFLDNNLCVRRFTPSSQKLFGIRNRDIGRSIDDLKWKVKYDDLVEDAAHVVETLQPIDREVSVGLTGDTYLLRIRPYRRTDNRIEGSVLTLIDITARKRTEKQLAANAETLARQYAELETLYDTTPVGLSLLDRDLRYLRINERLAEINGIPADDHIGRTQNEMLPEIDELIRTSQLQVLETGEPSLGNKVTGTTPAQPSVERHWIVDYYPVRTLEGEVFALGTCVNEVTDQMRLQLDLEQALAALTESEERLGFALEAGQIGTWEYDLETGETDRTLLHDQIFGFDELQEDWSFEDFVDYICEEDREATIAAFEEGVSNQASYAFQCRIVRTDNVTRWIEVRARPRFSTAGQFVGFAGTVADINERKVAERRQSLLLHELQHRVKNTLATVLAIIRFSSKRTNDVAELTKTLNDRLVAISKTHDLLTAHDWGGANLNTLVEQEIQPYAENVSDRLSLEGDNPKLSAKEMLALTLAFHELVTNAAKYGALSNDDGRITLQSSIDDKGELELTWRESGGPKVTEPDRQETGFGSFLLEQVIGPDLEGASEVRFKESGLTWTAKFPLDGD